MPNPLTFQYLLGQPIKSGNRTITPISKSWRYQLPGQLTRVSWDRPSSVLVQYGNEEVIIPVPDITRRLILTILGAGLGAILILWVITRFTRKTYRR